MTGKVEVIRVECFHYDGGCCRLTPNEACKLRLVGHCYRFESPSAVLERGFSRFLGRECGLKEERK